MTTSLKGRTALVTGAGRGVGRSVALGLAEAGVTVALVARSRDELAETAAQVKELGADALVIPADLSDPGQVASITGRTASEPGTIGILINNAAVVAPLGPVVHAEPAGWTAAIQISVIAPPCSPWRYYPA